MAVEIDDKFLSTESKKSRAPFPFKDLEELLSYSKVTL